MAYRVYSFVVGGSDRSPGPIGTVDYEDPIGDILREAQAIAMRIKREKATEKSRHRKSRKKKFRRQSMAELKEKTFRAILAKVRLQQEASINSKNC